MVELGSFHTTILYTATVILTISLVILGIFIKKATMNASYPPVISECPDYWDVTNNVVSGSSMTSVGTSAGCVNVSRVNEGLGSSDCTNISSSQFMLNGTTEANILCSKYKWAKSCNIAWDGVSNNTSACAKASI